MYRVKQIRDLAERKGAPVFLSVMGDGTIRLGHGLCLAVLQHSKMPKTYEYLGEREIGHYLVKPSGAVVPSDSADMGVIFAVSHTKGIPVVITDNLSQNFERRTDAYLRRELRAADDETFHVQERHLDTIFKLSEVSEMEVNNDRTILTLRGTKGETVGIIALFAKSQGGV